MVSSMSSGGTVCVAVSSASPLLEPPAPPAGQEVEGTGCSGCFLPDQGLWRRGIAEYATGDPRPTILAAGETATQGFQRVRWPFNPTSLRLAPVSVVSADGTPLPVSLEYPRRVEITLELAGTGLTGGLPGGGGLFVSFQPSMNPNNESVLCDPLFTETVRAEVVSDSLARITHTFDAFTEVYASLIVCAGYMSSSLQVLRVPVDIGARVSIVAQVDGFPDAPTFVRVTISGPSIVSAIEVSSFAAFPNAEVKNMPAPFTGTLEWIIYLIQPHGPSPLSPAVHLTGEGDRGMLVSGLSPGERYRLMVVASMDGAQASGTHDFETVAAPEVAVASEPQVSVIAEGTFTINACGTTPSPSSGRLEYDFYYLPQDGCSALCAGKEGYNRADATDYTGQIAVTAEGAGCVPWTGSEWANLPSVPIFGAACRNPGGLRQGAWCPTKDGSFGYCDVGPPCAPCRPVRERWHDGFRGGDCVESTSILLGEGNWTFGVCVRDTLGGGVTCVDAQPVEVVSVGASLLSIENAITGASNYSGQALLHYLHNLLPLVVNTPSTGNRIGWKDAMAQGLLRAVNGIGGTLSRDDTQIVADISEGILKPPTDMSPNSGRDIAGVLDAVSTGGGLRFAPTDSVGRGIHKRFLNIHGTVTAAATDSPTTFRDLLPGLGNLASAMLAGADDQSGSIREIAAQVGGWAAHYVRTRPGPVSVAANSVTADVMPGVYGGDSLAIVMFEYDPVPWPMPPQVVVSPFSEIFLFPPGGEPLQEWGAGVEFQLPVTPQDSWGDKRPLGGRRRVLELEVDQLYSPRELEPAPGTDPHAELVEVPESAPADPQSLWEESAQYRGAVLMGGLGVWFLPLAAASRAAHRPRTAVGFALLFFVCMAGAGYLLLQSRYADDPDPAPRRSGQEYEALPDRLVLKCLRYDGIAWGQEGCVRVEVDTNVSAPPPESVTCLCSRPGAVVVVQFRALLWNPLPLTLRLPFWAEPVGNNTWLAAAAFGAVGVLCFFLSLASWGIESRRHKKWHAMVEAGKLDRTIFPLPQVTFPWNKRGVNSSTASTTIRSPPLGVAWWTGLTEGRWGWIGHMVTGGRWPWARMSVLRSVMVFHGMCCTAATAVVVLYLARPGMDPGERGDLTLQWRYIAYECIVAAVAAALASRPLRWIFVRAEQTGFPDLPPASVFPPFVSLPPREWPVREEEPVVLSAPALAVVAESERSAGRPALAVLAAAAALLRRGGGWGVGGLSTDAVEHTEQPLTVTLAPGEDSPARSPPADTAYRDTAAETQADSYTAVEPFSEQAGDLLPATASSRAASNSRPPSGSLPPISRPASGSRRASTAGSGAGSGAAAVHKRPPTPIQAWGAGKPAPKTVESLSARTGQTPYSERGEGPGGEMEEGWEE
eukprot:Hpha_TRINITY_DN16581_c0_g5::TRINITY_DN16581_c0_g5_i1::g.134446::m.134446